MPNPMTAQKSKITAINADKRKSTPKRIPPVPKSLGPAYKTEWQGIIKHLQDHDAWLPQKTSLIEAYLFNLMAMRQAQQVMADDGGIITPDGKPHPASAIISRHSGYVTKLAGQLGLGLENLKPNKPAQPSKPKTKSTWTA